LFYLSPDGRLMAVDATGGGTLQTSEPRPLFAMRTAGVLFDPNSALRWDIHPDGKRFLIDVLAADADQAPISVVLNWKP
jgi:hypothetical protein